MAVDALAVAYDAGSPETPRRMGRPRRRWTIGLALFAVFAGGLGYLVGNEVQANTQFDQAHHSLRVTNHHITVVLGELATVRHDLSILKGQVGVATTTLAQTTTQLKGVQAALATAQSNVSHQTSTISDLQTCLGGVTQALNALAVNDQNRAVTALNGVATSCQNAVATSG
jgi:chromosome segregation ATPase